MVPTENTAYPGAFVQMLRAMIRVEMGHESGLKFHYTEQQRSHLEGLICMVTRQNGNDWMAGAVVAYQNFCWSLVHNLEEKSQDRWENPIERFVWLFALRPDGSFIEPTSLTPLLAKLKYFCRLTTLYKAMFPDRDLHNMDVIE